jgi:hypothetical protein
MPTLKIISVPEPQAAEFDLRLTKEDFVPILKGGITVWVPNSKTKIQLYLDYVERQIRDLRRPNPNEIQTKARRDKSAPRQKRAETKAHKSKRKNVVEERDERTLLPAA